VAVVPQFIAEQVGRRSQSVNGQMTFRRDDRDPEQGWHLSAIQQVESGEPNGSGLAGR
jgi:hypothetical protein